MQSDSSMPPVGAGSVQRTCLTCGGTFWQHPSNIRRGGGRYCSRTCYHRGTARPVAERFWEYVNKTPTCWLWTGSANPAGYGHIGIGHTTKVRASRLSWELHNGPIPDGFFVCHKCDNPRCVNPAHLFLGTPKDNTQDAVRKGRIAHGDRSRARLHPESLPRGMEHPNAKLTDDLVRTIRQRYAAGALQRELAAEFGIGQTAIGAIVRRVRWKHVP